MTPAPGPPGPLRAPSRPHVAPEAASGVAEQMGWEMVEVLGHQVRLGVFVAVLVVRGEQAQ